MPLYHIIELTSTCWWKDMKPIRTVCNLLWRAEPGQDYIRNRGVKMKRKKEWIRWLENKEAEKGSSKKRRMLNQNNRFSFDILTCLLFICWQGTSEVRCSWTTLTFSFCWWHKEITFCFWTSASSLSYLLRGDSSPERAVDMLQLPYTFNFFTFICLVSFLKGYKNT